ncbi:MAG: cytochrome b, partial [Sphingomonadales bacterium]
MSSGTFKPKNKLIVWFDDRLPILSLMHGVLVDYPTPKNLNYWWNFGSIAGFLLVVQLITGIVLAMHDQPSTEAAFDSVEH